jgi:hypothetical protein
LGITYCWNSFSVSSGLNWLMGTSLDLLAIARNFQISNLKS